MIPQGASTASTAMAGSSPPKARTGLLRPVAQQPWLLLLLLQTASVLLLLLLPRLPPCEAQRIFIVGDSLTETGNGNYLTGPKSNFAPYGINFSPSGPNGRFGNGKVFSDFISEKAGIPTPPPSFQTGADFSKGINFAAVGAVVFYKNISLTTFNIEEQVQALTDKVNNGLVPNSKDIVVAIFASNDLLVWLQRTSFANWGSLGNRAADAVANSSAFYVEKLYNLGFKNIIVGNIPALGCLPIVRFTASKYIPVPQCFGLATSPANRFNTQFNTLITRARTRLTGSNILLLNNNAAFGKAASNIGKSTSSPACCGGPAPTNGNIQCGKPGATLCAEPNKSVYWDNIHPTEAMVSNLFNLFWNSAGTTYVTPINIKALFTKIGI